MMVDDFFVFLSFLSWEQGNPMESEADEKSMKIIENPVPINSLSRSVPPPVLPGRSLMLRLRRLRHGDREHRVAQDLSDLRRKQHAN